MKRLIAGAQYDDWKGTSSFDDSDDKSLSLYTRKKGLISGSDVIFGIELFHHAVSNEFSIKLHFSDKNFDEFKSLCRVLEAVEFNMPIGDFFGLFKRASIVISRSGIMS
ncbi:hypothetical protein [Aeromonas media]|uniref:hypothetical protein n=1 Tax=Aeromonas media TaxID=651 RepID=UPI003D1EEF32